MLIDKEYLPPMPLGRADHIIHFVQKNGRTKAIQFAHLVHLRPGQMVTFIERNEEAIERLRPHRLALVRNLEKRA